MSFRFSHFGLTGRLAFLLALPLLLAAAGCAPAPSTAGPAGYPTPTIFFGGGAATPATLPEVTPEPIIARTAVPVDLDRLASEQEVQLAATAAAQRAEEVFITVDAAAGRRPISPLIYGVGNAPPPYLSALRPALLGWTGSGALRYNWNHGNAWNRGNATFYRNETILPLGGNAALDFVEKASAVGAESFMVLPTLGWVARDGDPGACSFPTADGNCGTGRGSTCLSPAVLADPSTTSLASTPEDVIAFLRFLEEEAAAPAYLAVLHNPELWGVTHYDVHPNCTTYQEILDTYVLYATALKEERPDLHLTGPGTCCWWFYWRSPAGSEDEELHDNEPFLDWFLQEMRRIDEERGQRHLDYLDVQYFPEGVYNSGQQTFIADQRLRSTRTLWDRTFVDESWIREPIALIPRLKELIEENYPGTGLALSGWAFGAEDSMNGGLAIADALGIFGREGVDLAVYQGHPPAASPGYYAFRMYTQLDGSGRGFGDLAVESRSSNQELVSVYAAIDEDTGALHIILINKIGGFEEKPVTIQIDQYNFQETVELFRYTNPEPFGSRQDPGIRRNEIAITSNPFILPISPSAIYHLVFQPRTQAEAEESGS